MRILVVHNRHRSSFPSGEDRVVDQEQAALAAAGHAVECFEARSDDIAGFGPLDRATVPTRVLWSPGAARDLGRAIERFVPHVVHVHNVFPLLSPSVLTTCRRLGVPAVVTFHNYRLVCAGGTLFRSGTVCRDCVGLPVPTAAVRHGCYRDSAAATFPLALASVAHRRIWRSLPSAYIFISGAQRSELQGFALPPERCFVKHNLVPAELGARPVDSRTRQDLVVYLGRLTEAKGLRLLQQGWDRYLTARAGGAGLRLAIAGTGPLAGDLASWAAGRPSVSLLGLLDREQSADLVASARAVVVPSAWMETFGLVALEAMAAGTVPVATAHGSFPELIADRSDGLLFPPADPAALGQLLQRLEADPAWAEQLGQAARRTYERRFRPEANLAQLEAIYQFAIEHPRHAPAAADGELPAGSAAPSTAVSGHRLDTLQLTSQWPDRSS